MLIISFIPEVFSSAKSEEEKQATEFSQFYLRTSVITEK